MGGSLILFQPPVLGKFLNKITSGVGVLKISKEPAKSPQRTHAEPMVQGSFFDYFGNQILTS
jgi:hypothetical protein